MAANRAVPAALALLALVGMTTLAVGAGPAVGFGTSAAGSPTDGGLASDAAVAPAASATTSGTPRVATGDEFTECTNGTSRSMLACGYQPGPTSVAFAPQETGGDAVTVRAVNLSAGGFVAVHRASFVDGEVVESVVGTSSHLDAGLHRNVRIALDRPLDADATLVAVVYRDDGDEAFEFVATDGATDRPYTNTYSPSAGNVTDEAGDVIGDTARVTVVDATGPVVVVGSPALDPDGDGRYEDVNGDGDVTPGDATVLFNAVVEGNAAVTDNVASFDFNGDGGLTPGDATVLFREGFS